MNRREALTLLGGTTLGLLSGCTSEAPVPKPSPLPKPQASPSPISAENVLQHKYEESTLQSRALLGLKGHSPAGASASESQRESWGAEAKPLEIDLPVDLQSYGKMFEFYLDHYMPQDVYKRLIRGITVDPSKPNENRFYPQTTRMLYISKGLSNVWIPRSGGDWGISGFSHHELHAHVPDTEHLADVYPARMFWPIEAAKWQMLTQVNTVSGPLVENNFNWTMNAAFPTNIGEKVAKDYVDNSGKMTVIDQGREHIPKIVEHLAEVRKVEPAKLRFNKYTSYELGQRVLEQLRAGNFTFIEELQNENNTFLVQAFVEIFAEMVRGAQTDFDLVNNNQTIISGVQQISSALRGDSVSIEKLRLGVKDYPPEIDALWEEERKLYKDAPPIYSSSVPDPIKMRTEQIYRDVVQQGPRGLPYDFTLDGKDLALWRDHLEAVQIICRPYYRLSNLDPKNYRDRFDPNLHLWQIKEIEKALDPDYIQTFIKDHLTYKGESLSKEERQNLVNKTVVMQGFISSDAFGT